MTAKTDLDVAVIGGGIAGLYAAYRLVSNGRTVGVFERQQDVGGRLLSLVVDGVPLELGAMRFRDDHYRLRKLLEELGVDTVEFGVMDTRYYLRGQRNTGPYRLPADEERCVTNNGVDGLIVLALENACGGKDGVQLACSNNPVSRALASREVREGLAAITPKEWERFQKKAQVKMRGLSFPLYTVGFWNFLEQFLSNEAYQLVHDALGYESIVDNWNAADAIPWVFRDFAPTTWRTVHGGFHRVAEELEKKIRSHPNARINTGRSLCSLRREANRWRLTFDVHRQTRRARPEQAVARHVVLAIPPDAINKLLGGDAGVGRELDVNRLSSAIRSHRLLKVLMTYRDSSWWTRVLHEGTVRVVTDLPIRQVYFFGPRWIDKHSDKRARRPNIRYGVVMASYSDERYEAFWHPLLEGKPRHNPLYQPHKLPSKYRRYAASQRLVQKVRKQLGDLLGTGKPVPPPVCAVVQHWESNAHMDEGLQGRNTDVRALPWDVAGWHTWNVHKCSWEVMDALKRGCHGLFVCGEAYSRDQGWVEGALQSAEDAVASIPK